MLPRQLIASAIIALMILAVVIRLVQRGHLDIAYCWLWLGIGGGMLLLVLNYEWLLKLSDLIGAVTPTTTIFLMGFMVVLLLCLQFSLVISTHRRQIKRLTQRLAVVEREHAESPVAASVVTSPSDSKPT
jgi:hypothetical protein